jgi:hypothetical protein
MQNRTRLGLAAVFGATVLVAACSGDEQSPNVGPKAGSGGTPGVAGSAMGGALAGSFGTAGTTAGVGGTFVTGGMAGTGGAGGAAGGSAGTAGTTTAGAGGTPHVIVPTVLVIDNIRLQLKTEGAGGGGGAGGAGEPGAGGAGGAGDAAGAPNGGAAALPPDFVEPFDTGLGLLAIHSDGFSPGAGDSGGPPIFDMTTLTFDATAGKQGGGAKLSVPFTVATQQADVAGKFDPVQDLFGYELLADVKLTGTGDVGACPSAWLYVYGGGGYANDKSAEPAKGVTSHLVKDEWTTIRLDLDGPYGYHSVTYHPNFKPTAMQYWGVQFNTWGCP